MAERTQAVAIARGVNQTPRKVSLVAALVRGRTVADAQVILSHTPKRSASPIAKVIASASANATHSFGAIETSLIIKSLEVTSGPRLKRFRASAMGRASAYEKRSSHIKVIVEGEIKPKRQPALKKPTEKEIK